MDLSQNQLANVLFTFTVFKAGLPLNVLCIIKIGYI